MNNSKTPKIIVGVGLAVVYAAGISFYMLRGSQDSVAAPAPATAPAAQIEVAPYAPAESAVATPAVNSPADAAAHAIAEDAVRAESHAVTKSTGTAVTAVPKPQSARVTHRDTDSPSAAVALVSRIPASGAAGSGASIESEIESSPAQEGGVSIATEDANIPAESSSDMEGAGEGNLEAN